MDTSEQHNYLDPKTPELPGHRIDTPSAFYCTGEEFLRVSSFGSVAAVELAIRSRFLRRDGTLAPTADRHVPTSNRTVATTDHPLSEGWLLGCALFASSGAPRIGQVFVVVDLMRGSGSGATLIQTLAQGYITDTQRLSWPSSPIRSSIDGPGVLRSITGTDPAANVEISETVPTNARWRVHAIRFTLVTDANAANREVSLTLDDGTLVYCRVPSRATQAASLTFAYSAFFDSALEAVAQDTERTIRLPRLDMQGGHRFATVTTNRQVTDNYSAPQYLVEEWIED